MKLEKLDVWCSPVLAQLRISLVACASLILILTTFFPQVQETLRSPDYKSSKSILLYG